MGFAQGCFALLFIHFRHPGVIQRFCLLTLLKSAGPLNRWTEKKIKYKILKKKEKNRNKKQLPYKIFKKKEKKENTVIMKGKKALK